MDKRRKEEEEEERGLVWKLPVVKSKQLGKMGPAFGFGAGCGVGFGLGFMGGIGVGPGIPGLQLGFGVGGGCGVGFGFGYGLGRGIAHDELRRYSNINIRAFPTQDEIGVLIDDVLCTTKRLIKRTSREIEKWRR